MTILKSIKPNQMVDNVKSEDISNAKWLRDKMIKWVE